MRFRNRASDTVHPANTGYDFRLILDMTDPLEITLNGAKVTQLSNKCSSSYTFSESTVAYQPDFDGSEIEWDTDAESLRAGSDYMFFEPSDGGMSLQV